MEPRWITSDAVGLGIIGLAASLRGISYLPHVVDQSRKAAHFLEEIAPPAVWSWVWISVGLLCLAAIPLRRLMPPAVGAGIGLHFMWATSFILSGGRGWVTAISYGAITLLALWAFGRGRRQPHREVPDFKGEP